MGIDDLVNDLVDLSTTDDDGSMSPHFISTFLRTLARSIDDAAGNMESEARRLAKCDHVPRRYPSRSVAARRDALEGTQRACEGAEAGARIMMRASSQLGDIARGLIDITTASIEPRRNRR